MLKRYLFALMLGLVAFVQITGCAPLAAGVAGAAIGHEVAEHDDDDD